MQLFNHHIIRYGTVGVANVIIDYSALNFCHLVLNLNLFTSVMVGFIAANTVAYLLHSRWTFQFNTSGQEAQKFSQFITVGIISLIGTEIIVHLLTYEAGIYYNIAKGIAIIVTALWAYSAMRWWIFRTAT